MVVMMRTTIWTAEMSPESLAGHAAALWTYSSQKNPVENGSERLDAVLGYDRRILSHNN